MQQALGAERHSKALEAAARKGLTLREWVRQAVDVAIAFEEGRSLTKQQETVSSILAAFAEFGEEDTAPKPALLVKWAAAVGGAAELERIVRSLGERGHLAKGAAYLAGAVLKEAARRQARVQRVMEPKYTDGETLESGYRWSSALSQWVPGDQWQAAS